MNYKTRFRVGKTKPRLATMSHDASWSKLYRGQVYENPPAAVFDPASHELSREECRVLARQMSGMPVCEEHNQSVPVGRVERFEQDPRTGSLWAEFRLRTDTPTFRKVASGEMRGLSLGHEIDFTFPQRQVRGKELSVCKKGRRANTMIVNASASSQQAFFQPAAPRALSCNVMFQAPNGFDLVPDDQPEPQLTPPPAALPMRFVGPDGRSYSLKPRPVLASSSAAPVAQPAAPTAQPMAQPQQQTVQLSSLMPYPFNQMNTHVPQQLQQTFDQRQIQAQQQQQQQQTQPQVQQQQPPAQQQEPAKPEQDTRAKAAKRKAPADEKEAEGEMETSDDSEAKAEPPAFKKPATASKSSADRVPETAEELKNAAEAIAATNMPANLKETTLRFMNDAFESRQALAKLKRDEANGYVNAIEQNMRHSGQSEEQISVWKASLKTFLENPLRDNNTMTMLQGFAASIGQRAGAPRMNSGMSSEDLALQRQFDRVNQIVGQPPQQTMQVLASASQGEQFPVRGTLQIPMVMADGRTSVFQARAVNPAALRPDPSVTVKHTPDKGWLVDGVPQRQHYYEGPPQA